MTSMHISARDRICGAVLASALGDAFGAPYEGGVVERLVWLLLGKSKGKRRWTDDTQMSIDVIESLLACNRVDQDDLAQRFARSYRWSRGYGPGAARLLQRIRQGEHWQTAHRAIYSNGSLGNGGAMRAAPLGLFYRTEDEKEAVQAVRSATLITHAHPAGQDGAVLIALTVALVCQDLADEEIFQRIRPYLQTKELRKRLGVAKQLLATTDPVTPRQVVSELGNGIRAQDSCVTACYIGLALSKSPFSQLLAYTRNVGGDTDTIGAMAGAIWGATCGYQQLPENLLQQLEQRQYLNALAQRFADSIVQRSY